jgi:hypothetical protein
VWLANPGALAVQPAPVLGSVTAAPGPAPFSSTGPVGTSGYIADLLRVSSHKPIPPPWAKATTLGRTRPEAAAAIYDVLTRFACLRGLGPVGSSICDTC